MEKKNNIHDQFKIPEGYFEQLPRDISRKIELRKKQKKIQMYSLASLAVAASVFSAVLIFNREIPENKVSLHQQEIAKDSIKKSKPNDSITLPKTEKAQLKTEKTDVAAPQIEIEELTEEEILDYLSEQELEIDLS